MPKRKRVRSFAARQQTIETAGHRAAVIHHARNLATSLAGLLNAVALYENPKRRKRP